MSYEDDVYNAIADAMEPIAGLQQTAYVLSNPTPPTAEVIPGEVLFDRTMQRGMDQFTCLIRVTVPNNSDVAMQRRLREFREPDGPTSIKEHVEADRRLGGLVDSLQVRRFTELRQFRRPSGDVVLGFDAEVLIYGSPSA